MTLEQVEAAGAKVWLDGSLVVKFAGPESVKAQLRADPNIKIELRKDLMIREFCQLCWQFGSQSHRLKIYWEDLESLPRKMALELKLKLKLERDKELAELLIGITWRDWEPIQGEALVATINRIFDTKKLRSI